MDELRVKGKQESQVEIPEGALLNISQVALVKHADSAHHESNEVYCKVNGERYVLCTLTPGNTEQFSLMVSFSSEDLSLGVNGPGEVHFVGNVEEQIEGDMEGLDFLEDEESGESDESDEGGAEEAHHHAPPPAKEKKVPAPGKNQKKAPPAQPQATSPAPAPKQPKQSPGAPKHSPKNNAQQKQGKEKGEQQGGQKRAHPGKEGGGKKPKFDNPKKGAAKAHQGKH